MFRNFPSQVTFTAGCLLFLAVAGCSSSTPYDQHLQGDFQPNDADLAVALIEEFVAANSLSLEKKDHSQMSPLTQGKPAFFVYILPSGKSKRLMTVGNLGPGNVISFTLLHGSGLPQQEETRLFDSLVEQFLTKSLVSNLQDMRSLNGT